MAHQKDVKLNESVTSTRDYTTGWVNKRTLKGGTKVIVTKISKDLWTITHLTVRDPKSGDFFYDVPWEYFRSD